MNELEVIDIARGTIWIVLKLSLPMLLVSLVVGTFISFFQAITQIQEVSLTFIPKIIAVFVVMLFLMPLMGNMMKIFCDDLFRMMLTQHS